MATENNIQPVIEKITKRSELIFKVIHLECIILNIPNYQWFYQMYLKGESEETIEKGAMQKCSVWSFQKNNTITSFIHAQYNIFNTDINISHLTFTMPQVLYTCVI